MIYKYGCAYPLQNKCIFDKAHSSQLRKLFIKSYTLQSGMIIHYQSKPEL